MQKINTHVLMSGAEYFDDGYAINAHMDDKIPVDVDNAIREHADIAHCFEQAGISVTKVPAPVDCQDGVYTANWALISGKKAIMANLPNAREGEEPYAEKILVDLGYQTVKLPKDIRFSGQGDALPCGKYLFVGTTYRTSAATHPLLARETGFEVIGVQTIPKRRDDGTAVINDVTGWPDSFFYDLDLALAVIRPDLIAWCPDAFEPESAQRIRDLQDIDKIEVSLDEAMHGFACNLVSTGESVVMSNHAPELKKALQDRGLTVYTPEVTELLKGGGFIRCTSLTLF
jgi:N-dimethylarginine dimethylaminohydrolase